MNYQRIYNAIIDRARKRNFVGYSERHHATPRCLRGSNDPTNIVRLTGKEHFIAHALLTRIYPNEVKLRFAFNMMSVISPSQERIFSRLFETNRIKLSVDLSNIHRGRIVSQETRELKSRRFTQEMRDAVSRRFRGRPSWNRGLTGEKHPSFGKKRPGIGGRKKGCVYTGPRTKTLEHLKKTIASKKRNFAPTMNSKGYEILTPTGFQKFAGIAYRGLVHTIRFCLENGKSIVVSLRHRFNTEKISLEYKVGDYILTESGESKIISITKLNRKQVFDVLDVDGGHVYYGNGIVNHNCEFVTDTNLAIIPEWKDDYIQSIDRDEYFKYYHCYEAMDIGTVDFTACLYAYYDFKKAKLIIEDEFHMNGPEMTTDVLAKMIRQKESDLDYRSPYLRISDNNNLILLQDLSYLHKMPFSPTSKDDLQAMVNEVRLWVSQGRVLIHPRCKMLICNLKYGLFNKKRKEFERSKIYGHYDHLAALVYLIRNVNQHTNPIPSYLGYRYDVIENNAQDGTEASLVRLFGPKLGRRHHAVLGS